MPTASSSSSATAVARRPPPPGTTPCQAARATTVHVLVLLPAGRVVPRRPRRHQRVGTTEERPTTTTTTTTTTARRLARTRSNSPGSSRRRPPRGRCRSVAYAGTASGRQCRPRHPPSLIMMGSFARWSEPDSIAPIFRRQMFVSGSAFGPDSLADSAGSSWCTCRRDRLDWTVVVLCTLLKYSHVERDVLP